MSTAILSFFIGAALAAIITWLAMRGRSAALTERLSLLQQEREGLNADVGRLNQLNAQLRQDLGQAQARVESEKKLADEKLALLNDATKRLSDTFAALSSDALKSNNQAFLDLAKERLESLQKAAGKELESRQSAVEALVKPIEESLKKVDTELREIENRRIDAYSGLLQQVQSLTQTQEKLQAETGALVKALRRPTVRGRWGELQLRRVVEMAGMLPYCDFVEQQSVTTQDGRLRPDLIVRLPAGKNIIVDSKAPLEAYLDAHEESDDDAKAGKLAAHARQIRDHIAKLSQKSYSQEFQPALDFVVMFLPGESFFSEAVHSDPTLLEYASQLHVIPSSPTTLIGLLRAVAYGWQQQSLAENAQKISDLGRELYDRLRTMSDHFEDVGKGLHKAVDSYNKTVSSMESRVLVSARKLKELGATTKDDIPELQPIESAPRPVQSEDAPALPARSAASGKN